MLGGVEIPEAELGLAGHSDADVLAHALIDALLGAAGLGDIGQHYPDSDERWRDADSLQLLGEVASFLGDHGWTVRHMDVTVLCEAPRLGPHRDEMRAPAGGRGGPGSAGGQREVLHGRGNGLRGSRRRGRGAGGGNGGEGD